MCVSNTFWVLLLVDRVQSVYIPVRYLQSCIIIGQHEWGPGGAIEIIGDYTVLYFVWRILQVTQLEYARHAHHLFIYKIQITDK